MSLTFDYLVWRRDLVGERTPSDWSVRARRGHRLKDRHLVRPFLATTTAETPAVSVGYAERAEDRFMYDVDGFDREHVPD